nr:restriction endonuclease [Paenibacillus foliorum]
MSRKKKKVERELWKLIEGLLVICIFGAFFGVFNLTKSITAGIVAAGCVFGLFVGVMFYRKMLYEEKLKKSGIKDIDEMDGRQFEHYLGHLFRAHGYAVQVTRAAGDYGADLVIVKDGKKSLSRRSAIAKTWG